MSLDDLFRQNPGMRERVEQGKKILEARKNSSTSTEEILTSIDETLRRGREALERSKGVDPNGPLSSASERLRKSEERIDQLQDEIMRRSGERFALTQKIRLEQHEADMVRRGSSGTTSPLANSIQGEAKSEQILRSPREEFDHVNFLRLNASEAPLTVAELSFACKYAAAIHR